MRAAGLNETPEADYGAAPVSVLRERNFATSIGTRASRPMPSSGSKTPGWARMSRETACFSPIVWANPAPSAVSMPVMTSTAEGSCRHVQPQRAAQPRERDGNTTERKEWYEAQKYRVADRMGVITAAQTLDQSRCLRVAMIAKCMAAGQEQDHCAERHADRRQCSADPHAEQHAAGQDQHDDTRDAGGNRQRHGADECAACEHRVLGDLRLQTGLFCSKRLGPEAVQHAAGKAGNAERDQQEQGYE